MRLQPILSSEKNSLLWENASHSKQYFKVDSQAVSKELSDVDTRAIEKPCRTSFFPVFGIEHAIITLY